MGFSGCGGFRCVWAAGYYGDMGSKRVPLTKAEKDRNVALGLTPLGKIPQRVHKPRQKPVRKPVAGLKQPRGTSYPAGDYRCRGTLFTAARKNRYLEIIREVGEEPLARAEVGVSYHTVNDHKKKDPIFKDAIDEAFRQHASIYSKEMIRRGVVGVDEPVFGSGGKDAGTIIVGTIRRYSDKLLMEQAKRFQKEYTPRQVVESTIKAAGPPSLGLEALSPESRADLRRILEREEALRGTIVKSEPEPEPEPEPEDEE